MNSERFQPYLWLKNSRSVPSPIFAVALTDIERWKKLDLPESFSELDIFEQLDFLEKFIQDHYLKILGGVSPFGIITGYYCFVAENQIIEFDTNGKYMGTLNSLDKGHVSMKIKNKDIPFKLS